jgi:hypothetical protein
MELTSFAAPDFLLALKFLCTVPVFAALSRALK